MVSSAAGTVVGAAASTVQSAQQQLLQYKYSEAGRAVEAGPEYPDPDSPLALCSDVCHCKLYCLY